MRELISQCWSANSDDRPGFSEIRSLFDERIDDELITEIQDVPVSKKTVGMSKAENESSDKLAPGEEKGQDTPTPQSSIVEEPKQELKTKKSKNFLN